MSWVSRFVLEELRKPLAVAGVGDGLAGAQPPPWRSEAARTAVRCIALLVDFSISSQYGHLDGGCAVVG